MHTRRSAVAATQVVVTTETLPRPIAPTVDFAAFFKKEKKETPAALLRPPSKSVKREFAATAENTGPGAAAGILATPKGAGSVASNKQKKKKSAGKGKGKGAMAL